MTFEQLKLRRERNLVLAEENARERKRDQLVHLLSEGKDDLAGLMAQKWGVSLATLNKEIRKKLPHSHELESLEKMLKSFDPTFDPSYAVQLRNLFPDSTGNILKNAGYVRKQLQRDWGINFPAYLTPIQQHDVIDEFKRTANDTTVTIGGFSIALPPVGPPPVALPPVGPPPLAPPLLGPGLPGRAAPPPVGLPLLGPGLPGRAAPPPVGLPLLGPGLPGRAAPPLTPPRAAPPVALPTVTPPRGSPPLAPPSILGPGKPGRAAPPPKKKRSSANASIIAQGPSMAGLGPRVKKGGLLTTSGSLLSPGGSVTTPSGSSDSDSDSDSDDDTKKGGKGISFRTIPFHMIDKNVKKKPKITRGASRVFHGVKNGYRSGHFKSKPNYWGGVY